MKVNDYFNFTSSPFSRNTSKLYESKDYLEIKKRLDFFLEEDGLALITGSHGTGKSVIINSLVSKKDKVITINNSDLTLFEFLNCIGRSLEVEVSHCHLSLILDDIRQRVFNYSKIGSKVILIIDDSESLDIRILENLKYLYELDNMYIILVGHTNFRNRCKDHRLLSLANNTITNYDLVGLSSNETKEYIKFRLRQAKSDENLIEDKYYSNIHEFTKGNPQLINKYMATVFLIAAINDTKIINNSILKQAKDEIEI